MLYLLSLELWESQYNKWIAAGLGILLLLQYIFQFFNLYLDALVYTKKGVKILTRESFLEYKMEVFDREHIQVVSFEQKSLWDTLFMKGCLRISLMTGSHFTFDDIDNPQKEAKKMLSYKDKFESQASHSINQEKQEKDKEKFNILVETLGEIIQEYSGNNAPSTDNPFDT